MSAHRPRLCFAPWLRAALAAGLLAACAEPEVSTRAATAPSLGAARAPDAPIGELVEVVYDGGFGPGWEDYGWTPRSLGKGPASLDMAAYGGWIVAHPGLSGRYGALVFQLRAPVRYGDFLEVRVASDKRDLFPQLVVRAEHRAPLADGWVQVVVPLRELNPDALPFDRVMLRAARPVGSERVLVDKLGFTAPAPGDIPRPPPADAVTLTIDCRGPGVPVSPLIYGIAYDPRLDAKEQHQHALGATARRWGGNPASRYNWELGAAWNTANDWFFENVDYTGAGGAAYATFLRADLERGLSSALTVPMLGWVAKDTSSYAFPVATMGAQQAVDPYKADAGNGVSATGKPLPPGPPSRTSVPSSPESIRRWIERIRAEDQKRGARSVAIYILDNEPMLWSSTHRDVHPEPVTYDELLERTLRYGAAVRAADPDALIAGPAEWGWPALFFSAKDAAEGFHLKPDRRAHGDVPLLAWYLQQLRAHEERTGERLLDLVDVHFYPQAEGVGGPQGGSDARTAALRIRSTRALWDPSYTDESWIKDRVELIPRLQRLIAENYPGRGVMIGEYNFGAEQHVSSGLAVAEALGRFAQGGVQAAFYWTYPPDRSPAFWAFRAYRNFDGAGAHFLERSLPTAAPEGTSLFASRDERGAHVVAIALNFRPDRALYPTLGLTGCGAVTQQAVFQYTGEPGGFVPVTPPSGSGPPMPALPPSSITVFDLQLEAKP